jgi:hypothetical protein
MRCALHPHREEDRHSESGDASPTVEIRERARTDKAWPALINLFALAGAPASISERAFHHG